MNDSVAAFLQPPVPIEKHEAIYNATADAPLCPQPTSDPTSEDCLYLNVYSTKVSSVKFQFHYLFQSNFDLNLLKKCKT